MAEIDTIKIWYDHSVCTYEGYERIAITKKNDSIKVRTEFKEEMSDANPNWQLVYEKTIPTNDTIWKIEEFFERHTDRLKSDVEIYGTLQVSHNGIKKHFFTEGLVDLNRFTADYFKTMRELFPENKNEIYGVDLITEPAM